MGGERRQRWVARVTPVGTAESLLALPLGMDVWERDGDVLVVAADEAQLLELERRRLARVERLSTVEQFARWARRDDRPSLPEEGQEGAEPS